MNTEEVFVQLNGEVISVGDALPELRAMGAWTRRRASSIVPLNRGKRCAFLFLRSMFGERGRVAEWTRQWQGAWVCKLFATGETFIAQSRRVVLKWEHDRLNQILSE